MRLFQTTLLTIVILLTASVMNAQSGLPQIPEDAFFVSRISGSSLQSKMSIAELDGLPVFQSLFNEGMNKSEMTSLMDTGIDFDQETYVFAQKNDSITYLCWMLPLADLSKFKRTMLHEMGVAADASPPFTKADVTVYWNDRAAVFAIGEINGDYVELHSERLRETYGLSIDSQGMEDFYGYDEDVEVPDYGTEEEMEVTEHDQEAAEEAMRQAVESAINAAEDATNAVEEAQEAVAEEYEYEIVEEPVMEDEYSSGYELEESYEEYDPYAYNPYAYNYMTYSEKNQLLHAWQGEWTTELMSTVGSPMHLGSVALRKVAKSTADASAYFDYNAYMEMVMGQVLGKEMMTMGGMYPMMMSNMMSFTEGASLFSEIEFGEDEVEWDFEFTTTGKGTEMQADMFDSKLGKNYLNYMNSEDMIGFYTMAINSEAVIDYYAELMSMYVGAMSMNQEAGEASSELISLLLDEEAIADLFPGSAVITFSDLSKRIVEYTTYDYDENWNRTEVTKEKEEIMPTFLGMMETGRSELVNKLLRLATMEEAVVETDFGFQINEGPFPIYLMLKGGILFIGNDLAQINDIKQGRFKAGLSSEHKKAIKKNNSVLFFDSKELIEDLELEYPSGEMADMIAFAKGKAERITITSAMRDSNSSFMKAVIEVPSGEANGWSYMMHLFNSMYEMENRY